MTTTAELRRQLSEFDGKHTDVLQRTSDEVQGTAIEIRALIKLSGSSDVTLQTGATWVLKNLQECGLHFSDAQTTKLLALLDGFSHWEPILHVLQMMPEWKINKSQQAALRTTLDRLRTDDKKLVRAWAYNGLIALANQQPALRDEVRAWVTQDLHQEAASVQARVRNAIRQTDWISV
ncbi:MAG: hypothetical protein ACR2NZ_18835 [Rubripirellula sp.]